MAAPAYNGRFGPVSGSICTPIPARPIAGVAATGLASYVKLGEHRHAGKTEGSMAAHILLPWVHRVFAHLKRWLTGTFHGARKQHLKRYLDEFTFRWNRRRHTRTAFDNLLGLVTRVPHASRRACRRERSAFRASRWRVGRVARRGCTELTVDGGPTVRIRLPPADSPSLGRIRF
jgi:ISXO2-like transposase domain